MTTRLLAAALFGVALLQGCSRPEPADLVLFGGKVLTVDEKFTIHSAVVVKDGRILAVGDDALARKYSAPTQIDLKGRVLLPGFNDNHYHPSARSPRSVDAAKAHSIAELQELVRAKAREMKPGEWITGYGWDEAEFTEKRNPLRADLDAAAPDNPVVLSRAGLHSAVGNSLALKIAGIIRDEAPEIDIAGSPRLVPTYKTWRSIYAEVGAELPRATMQIGYPGPGVLEKRSCRHSSTMQRRMAGSSACTRSVTRRSTWL